MALHHSPKIVTDGLVFYYDKANTKKSWKGAPTTNLAMTSGSVTDWSIGNLVASVSRGTITVNEKYSITSTTGGAFRMYFNLSNLVNTETYNLSFKYQIISGGPTFDMNDWNDTSITKTEIDNGDGTFFQSAYGSRATYSSTYHFMDFNISANTVVHIWDIQLEERAFHTPYTSYQRTNTEAIIDMVGGNTITANSLTYTQNDFSFDGTNNYMNMGLSIDTYNKSYTLSAWIKRDIANNYDGIISDLQYNWQGFWIDSASKLRMKHKQTDVLPNELASIGTIGAGVWTHVTGTFELGVGSKLYINGKLDNSNSNINYFGLNGASRGPKYLGFYETGAPNVRTNKFDGNIDIFQGYSGKALTAAEVKQNFNATRSRFGI